MMALAVVRDLNRWGRSLSCCGVNRSQASSRPYLCLLTDEVLHYRVVQAAALGWYSTDNTIGFQRFPEKNLLA
jgi:hypothetical protein